MQKKGPDVEKILNINFEGKLNEDLKSRFQKHFALALKLTKNHSEEALYVYKRACSELSKVLTLQQENQIDGEIETVMRSCVNEYDVVREEIASELESVVLMEKLKLTGISKDRLLTAMPLLHEKQQFVLIKIFQGKPIIDIAKDMKMTHQGVREIHGKAVRELGLYFRNNRMPMNNFSQTVVKKKYSNA